MTASMKKNSDEYENIDQGVLNSDMPTGGLFASCEWAIYPKGGAIGPLFTFLTLDNYTKTDKVIIKGRPGHVSPLFEKFDIIKKV